MTAAGYAGAVTDPTAGRAALASAATSTERRVRAAFGRYRVMAFVTGGMLLLLTLEMVLKYVFQAGGLGAGGEPLPVLGVWVAIVHGWIYAVYAVVVFQLWSSMRWSLGRLAVLVLGGVVPFLSFIVEVRARRWFAADLPGRVERAQRLEGLAE